MLCKIFYLFRKKGDRTTTPNCKKVAQKDLEYKNCDIQSTVGSGEYGDFRGSIMMSPNFMVKNSLDFFCDDTGPHKHDRNMRTRHNDLCKRESAWAVIRKSKDYLDSGSPSSEVNVPATDFEVVQPREDNNNQRVVFVLDVSGSMSGESIDKLKSQCNDFIKSSEAIKLGFNLGIVEFR